MTAQAGARGLLLTLDVGNTNVCAALFDGERPIGDVVRFPSDREATSADWHGRFRSGVPIPAGMRVSGAILGSVVPPLDAPLGDAVRELFDVPLVDAAPIVRRILPILLAEPEAIGVDRLLDALAAKERYGAPVIVVDVGTATTLDLVDRSGAFAGGVIAPGPLLGAEALAARTAKLPRVPLRRPESVIGVDTVSAIASGLYFGYAGLLEGVIARLRREAPEAKVVATGGLAPVFADEGIFDVVDPGLTLDGLRISARHA